MNYKFKYFITFKNSFVNCMISVFFGNVFLDNIFKNNYLYSLVKSVILFKLSRLFCFNVAL